MTGVFTYPWTVGRRGVEATVADLCGRDVDELSVAAHYHSVQSLDPRTPANLFERFPGGCCFSPSDDAFASTPIDPPRVSLESETVLDRTIEAASARGMNVRAWTVCFHNTRLGVANPEYRTQSAFGDTHDHAFCPSHEAVQRYFVELVDELAARGFSHIDLESLGFPGAIHTHGREFGHLKNHALASPLGRALLSQCGCDACRARATDHHVEFDAAMREVRALCRDSLASTGNPHPRLESLLSQTSHLSSLLEFRCQVIEDLVTRLAGASGDVNLNYLVADGLGRGATDGRIAGVDLQSLSGLDSVTALCYTDDVDGARANVEALVDVFDGEVHATVTLDPAITASRQQFAAMIDGVSSAVTGEWFVYNDAIATEEHRSWFDALS